MNDIRALWYPVVFQITKFHPKKNYLSGWLYSHWAHQSPPLAASVEAKSRLSTKRPLQEKRTHLCLELLRFGTTSLPEKNGGLVFPPKNVLEEWMTTWFWFSEIFWAPSDVKITLSEVVFGATRENPQPERWVFVVFFFQVCIYPSWMDQTSNLKGVIQFECSCFFKKCVPYPGHTFVKSHTSLHKFQPSKHPGMYWKQLDWLLHSCMVRFDCTQHKERGKHKENNIGEVLRWSWYHPPCGFLKLQLSQVHHSSPLKLHSTLRSTPRLCISFSNCNVSCHRSTYRLK